MRGKQWLAFMLLGIVAALFSISCVTDLMRESDQASILTGSWNLFKGASVHGEGYYNYDKHYLIYWLLAGAFRVRALLGGEWSPVRIADACTAGTFWGTTLLALFRLHRRYRLPPLFILLCFLTTPTILLNSTYANAAILSAGLLILTAVLLEGRSTLCDVFACLAFAAAVGLRADAVLLAPLLVWLRTPSQKWLRRALVLPATWMLAAGAIFALWLGEWLYSGPRQFSDLLDAGFQGKMLKVFVAYTAVGLGPSFLLLIFIVAALAHRPGRRAFYRAGAVCLLLPLLYYSLQLYSPRYLILTAVGPFVFSISRRGTAFWTLCRGQRFTPLLRRIVLAASVAPMLLGMSSSVLTRPRLTFTRPTLFPTTDGLYPLGAYLSFMLKMRASGHQPIDHNQLVWKAAESGRYVPAADGRVHLFFTPMYSYLELAATIKGLQVVKEPEDKGVPLYSDSRSLLRVGSGQEGLSPSTHGLLGKPSRFVSEVSQGLGILEFNAGGDMAWGNQTVLLNRLFAANEYRLTKGSSPEPGIEIEGRRLVFFGANPFEVLAGGKAKRRAYQDPASSLFFVRMENGGTVRIVATDPAEIRLAVQALPQWMSVGR
jgi:hypothetical protein